MTKLASRAVLDRRLKSTSAIPSWCYQRVSKKLAVDLSKAEIEALVVAVLDDGATKVEKFGKNYYCGEYSW